jgi:hypothetical protein
MIDLILDNFEFESVCGSAKISRSMLTIFVFVITVVRVRELSITCPLQVAFICNANVVPTSKRRPKQLVVAKGVFGLPLAKSHFLLKLQLQNECLLLAITNVFIWRSPFQGSVCCKCLIELGTDDCNSVAYIIAKLVELSSSKVMLRRTKEEIHLRWVA